MTENIVSPKQVKKSISILNPCDRCPTGECGCICSIFNGEDCHCGCVVKHE